MPNLLMLHAQNTPPSDLLNTGPFSLSQPSAQHRRLPQNPLVAARAQLAILSIKDITAVLAASIHTNLCGGRAELSAAHHLAHHTSRAIGLSGL